MTELDVMVIGWSEKPDALTILINGQRYVYRASSFVRRKFVRLLPHSPGKALAYLKRYAEVIEKGESNAT